MARTGIEWKIVLAFAAIYIVWGSTYIVALIGLNGIPPFIMAALRFGCAGLLLLGWCRINRYPTPDKTSLKINSIGGILTLVCGSSMVIWSEQYMSSGLAAIAVASTPVWLVLLDRKQWQSYLANKLMLLGIVGGFIGICLLFGVGDSVSAGGDGAHLKGTLGLLTSCIGWAVGSLYLKYNPTGVNTISNASTQFLAGSAFALILGFSLGEFDKFSISGTPTNSWLALLYLIVFGSLIAYIAYVWLLTKRQPPIVGTYAYVNPVIAVFLGVQFANEKVNIQQTLALIAILLSVLLINFPKYFKGPPKEINT